jgi:hypothetical protein
MTDNYRSSFRNTSFCDRLDLGVLLEALFNKILKFLEKFFRRDDRVFSSLSSLYFFRIYHTFSSSVIPVIALFHPYSYVTVLLYSYSLVLNPHAQSNADKLAMWHGYPQCRKAVTAQCHIIPSPPLLSLSVFSCPVLYSQ